MGTVSFSRTVSRPDRMKLILLVLMLSVQQGFSIKCYERGGYPAKVELLCQTVDDLGPDGHQCSYGDRGYAVCIKIADSMSSKSMRFCKTETEVAKMGADAAKLGKNECKNTTYDLYQTGNPIPVTFCTCDTDDCNLGLRETANAFLLTVSLFVMFRSVIL